MAKTAKAKLNANEVKALMKKPGLHRVGEGLYLQVRNEYSRSWICKFQMNGRSREMGLGSCDLEGNRGGVTLAEAFDAAHEARKLARAGIDPIKARNAQLLKEANSKTFKECANQYIDMSAQSWKKPKLAKQWRGSLENHAYKVLGNLPVGEIEQESVRRVLVPIWTINTPTANLVLQRLHTIFEFAIVSGYRTAANPAEKGRLAKILPTQTHQVQPMPSLPYKQINAFLQELKGLKVTASRLALEFLILTAMRTDAIIGTRWTEINSGTWTVPGVRLKQKKGQNKPHKVPLSPAAKDVLRRIKEFKDYDEVFVFPGGRHGKGKGMPIESGTMDDVLHRMPGHIAGKYKDADGRPIVVHGFRSTFRDWGADSPKDYRDDVLEAALAHTIEGTVKGRYKRTKLFDKRQQVMNDWAEFCSQPWTEPVEGDNVVPFRAA